MPRRGGSSARWLHRQQRDRFVQLARREGRISRAHYKLRQLDQRFRLLRQGLWVLELGAAPGGWSQVAAARVGPAGRVVAVDTAALAPIDGVVALVLDARATGAASAIRAALDGPADLVMSDMAAPTTGHGATDRLRVAALCEAALDLAEPLLAPGGCFLAKLREGGGEPALRERLRRAFVRVRHLKPAASRKDSSERYVLAAGYRGAPEGAS